VRASGIGHTKAAEHVGSLGEPVGHADHVGPAAHRHGDDTRRSALSGVRACPRHTVGDCAANAYGSAVVISFLKRHPRAGGGTRLLFTVPLGGRTVALSVIIVAFAGTPATTITV